MCFLWIFLIFHLLPFSQVLPSVHIPVHGDAEEVEDGGGGEDHVHGIVDVTNPHGKDPVALEDHQASVEKHCTHGHGQV